MNRCENALTLCLALGIDGHFYVEQPACAGSGHGFDDLRRPGQVPCSLRIALTLLFVPYFEVFGKLTLEGVFEAPWWHPAATYVPFLAFLWLETSGHYDS